MAEEIVQYSRQAPFIEERAEQLLASGNGCTFSSQGKHLLLN
jgi:hypothetical protein